MSIVSAVGVRCLKRVGFATLCAAGMVIGAEVSPAVDALPNACPVDGCNVTIIGVERSGDELQLTLKSQLLAGHVEEPHSRLVGRQFHGGPSQQRRRDHSSW